MCACVYLVGLAVGVEIGRGQLGAAGGRGHEQQLAAAHAQEEPGAAAATGRVRHHGPNAVHVHDALATVLCVTQAY